MSTNPEPIYLKLSADDPDLGTTEIESMCMNCEKNVSRIFENFLTSWLMFTFVSGNYAIVAYQDSVLQRGRVDVIQLRSLWI